MAVQSYDKPGHVEKERQEQRFGHVRRALAAAKQDEREGRSTSRPRQGELRHCCVVSVRGGHGHHISVLMQTCLHKCLLVQYTVQICNRLTALQ